MPSLAPTFLLSMPQLQDPNFSRAVVLLCNHSEKGALGLVVNRPLLTTGRIVVNLEPPVSTERELEVWIGGPVEPERSWILVGGHPYEVDGRVAEGMSLPTASNEEAGVRIVDGLYLSTSPFLMQRLLQPEPPPRVRLVVGYSGWGPGQLEAELEASSWLISEVDPDLIFDTAPAAMWETAIRRLGADPAALQMSRGVH